jgi:hypothetical protein
MKECTGTLARVGSFENVISGKRSCRRSNGSPHSAAAQLITEHNARRYHYSGTIAAGEVAGQAAVM